MVRLTLCVATTVASCLLSAASARAYVDLGPTLARVVRESKSITLAEVDRYLKEIAGDSQRL